MQLIRVGVLVASLALYPVAAIAQDIAPTQDRICEADTQFKRGFCRLIVTSTVVFAVLDWLAPLNRPEADPLRCRGYGSIIKIKIPANQCAPIEDGSN